MPDFNDIGIGLMGGLQKGLMSYYDQKKANDQMAAEGAAKGLIQQNGKWVADPAALARKKAEEKMKAKIELSQKGLEPIYDSEDNMVDVQPSKFFDKIQNAKALANPFAQLLQQQTFQKNQAEMQDREDKKKESDLSLQTKYGKANTLEDAKAVKEAEEARAGLASLTDQMIELRQTHGGLGRFNPEANARGQQLSKQALLLKKKLDGLGVLSQSDMDIVNAIVPSDPNAINWSGFVGAGDPTMEKLKSFKKDTDDKMGSVIANRIRGGGQGLLDASSVTDKEQSPGFLQPKAGASGGFPRQVRNKDGAVATVQNQKELQEAMTEGFQ